MLLSKVNRRVSVAIESQSRKSLDSQKAQKKFAPKQQSKFSTKSKKTTTFLATSNNKSKVTVAELNPPSDSDEDLTSSKLDKYWRPSGGKGVSFSINPADNDSTSIKAQAKAEFDSISKRIAKVLDDYEYHQQVKRTELSTESLPVEEEKKDGVRGKMLDYIDVCDERRELLYQLQEWFEEDHLKGDLFENEDMDTGDIVGLKKTLMERQQVKRKLNMIKVDMDTRAMLASNQQKKEKIKIERELEETKDALEKIKNRAAPISAHLAGEAATDHANSWKFAASEIHQILAKARDAGTANLQVMEQKLAEMVINMTKQSEHMKNLEEEMIKKEEILNGTEVEIGALKKQKNEYATNMEKICTQLEQEKHAVQTQKQTITTQEATVKDLQEQIVALNKKVDDLKQENQELTEKATKASEELAAMTAAIPSPSPMLTRSTPSRSGSRGGSRASISADKERSVTTSPKVVIEMQSIGVQVGGIFLEPKVISLPTTTTGTQYDEEVSTPKKTERQQEHESQIQKLKSSLQLAYKEITDMQGLIEELQSQLLLPDEPQKDDFMIIEGDKSAASITTPYCTPSRSRESCTHITNCSITMLPKSTSDSIPTSMQRRQTIKSERPLSVEGQKCKSLSRMASLKTVDKSGSENLKQATNWLDTVSFSKLNLTPEELQDTMKRVLLLENDPKRVTKSIVTDALHQVNSGKFIGMVSQNNLASFQDELESMCDAIAGFLDYSSTLVEKEAKVVSDAVSSLLSKLPEDEKQKLQQSQVNEMKDKLQDKIADIVQPAFTALQQGGQLISSNMKQQSESLQGAMTALAEYKKKQCDSYQFELPPPDVVENQFELLPLREKLIPNKHGGISVKYEDQLHRHKQKGVVVPKLAKFPIVHGYHFVGGRLIYTKPPMARQGQRYRNLNKQFLSINATGYYGALGASNTASGRTYQMNQGRQVQKKLRPVSDYRKRRKTSVAASYHPGNILIPFNMHRSHVHPSTPPTDGAARRRHGQSKYTDIISNPEYFGKVVPPDPANLQTKPIYLPPIHKPDH